MEPWLYFGDCLEVMKTMPDNSIDRVPADLPYGTTPRAGRDYPLRTVLV
jgi:hypothetical protein